jgi:hypothetical protein
LRELGRVIVALALTVCPGEMLPPVRLALAVKPSERPRLAVARRFRENPIGVAAESNE